MKLPEHVNLIRELIYKSFSNQFARWGVGENRSVPIEELPTEIHNKRNRIDQLIESHIGETKSREAAREKALDELTFTLFNRIAAIKVMEAHALFPEIITKRSEHGSRSYSHKFWLDQNIQMKTEELEGLRTFLKQKFNELGEEINLFHRDYPYAILPYVIDLNEIIDAFNAVEKDPQIDVDIWKSDDILGWLYESYNNAKKKAFKDSKKKVEYDKVSLQSQVYTPRWVVKFLLDNSLGKLYMEMFPDSEIKNKYKIANIPDRRVREPKPLHEIKIIDPATGSGNFLLYAFDLFYDLYLDQIEYYEANYPENDISKLIIENNLHGIDLDDRSVQLAQLGLYIKAKRKNRQFKLTKINVVSSDFYLPDYGVVKSIFESSEKLDTAQQQLLQDIWEDLRNAYKFGSLIRVEEKINARISYWRSLFESKQLDAFRKEDLASEEIFRENFFQNLYKALQIHGNGNGKAFLLSKTKDAITYLEIISDKYDVACTNPPYTDSYDFGGELKSFIDFNYKKPVGFHTNLYASFIKRCSEFINENGKITLIHPLTFMYIQSFKDVRKFILEKLHISIFVDYGLSNLFGTVMVDPAFYVMERGIATEENSWFISLDQYTRTPNEKFKKDFCLTALDNFITGIHDKHNFTIPQSKFKIIKSWPFIYWISDAFREKFKEKSIKDLLKNCQGLATTNNNRFVRYWWEVDNDNISINYNIDKKKWVNYAKGGPFNKWFGNYWLVVDWFNEGYNIKEFVKEKYRNTSYAQGFTKERWDKLIRIWVVKNEQFYFIEGISYSASGSKGASYRYLPSNFIFDVGGSCIFPVGKYKNNFYILAFLNSKLSKYIIECLNPTVNKQVGDIERIPFIIPPDSYEESIEELANVNIEIKKYLCKFSIIETLFAFSPLQKFEALNNNLRGRIKQHLTQENHLLTQVLLNEAYINRLIFEIYGLDQKDIEMIVSKEGMSIGELPVQNTAKASYLSEQYGNEKFTFKHIIDFIKSLPEKEFTEEDKVPILEKLTNLYKTNYDLEEFCIQNQINPINVWFWFKESNIIPEHRIQNIAMEFLINLIREILNEDEDGIVPIVKNTGEEILIDRIERKFYDKGFTSAQISQLDSLLGRSLNEYLNKFFFRELSDHLNLFMYLPKTPFIWHLTSGEYQGFDVYIIIYKWNKDKLYRLKSIYIEKRESALINRQADLKDDLSANAQNEKDLIYRQLKEINTFKKKIDELLTESYDPVLDDGVGKNIAPLQKKGMLAYEVLNKAQLEKYLNADW
ncbi:BREX-1 system adenine-specific DNA-methyltransferase PglX [candidate division KSB1 bacterium]